MTWLVGQVWPYLVASGLAGALLTVVMSIRTIKVERPVEVPVEVPELLPVAADEPEQPSAVDGPAVPASPFPGYRGQPDARPWEAEELWSRPVSNLATPAARVEEAPEPQVDEWERFEDPLPPLPGSPFPALPAADDFPYATPVEAERP
jgi:hypothetical protein